ncbi:MAG: alpha/beta hydrolase [Chloroflexota bacterium]
MLDLLTMGTAFLVLFLGFWALQWCTRFFSTRYYLQVGVLIGIVMTSLYLVARLITGSISIQVLGIVLILLFVALYHLVVAIIKIRESDSRYRWIHKANRAVVSYDTPHERIALRTEDGERIQAIKLCHTPLETPVDTSNKAIIVCHGAGRSKNTLPVVQTVEILATKYDVFTFDFRGHMESSGVFKGDGDTEYDLKAMIEYVKRAGYEKIAVIGWSVGAWTALLSASRGRPVDAIVAGSPPPGSMTNLFFIRSLERMGIFQMPLVAATSIVRGMWVAVGKHILNIEDFVRKVPQIPILLVYNDYDRTLRASAEAFERLYEKLPLGSDKLRLPGKGHLFDWPNTYFLWTKMFEWLDQNF